MRIFFQNVFLESSATLAFHSSSEVCSTARRRVLSKRRKKLPFKNFFPTSLQAEKNKVRQSAAHLLPALTKKSCPDQREPLTGHREGTVGHRQSPQRCCQEVGDPPKGPNRSAIFSHVGAWHGVDLKQLTRIPRDTPLPHTMEGNGSSSVEPRPGGQSSASSLKGQYY